MSLPQPSQLPENLRVHHKVHVLKKAADITDLVHMMSIEANLKAKEEAQINVKSIIGDFHGCGAWRILYPSVIVSTMRENCKMSYQQSFDPSDQSLYKGHDLIIFQRQVAPGFMPAMQHFVQTRDQHKAVVVTTFEIDDWLFKIPKYNMAHDLYHNQLGEQHLESAIKLFDSMIVSTDHLKKMYSRKFPKEFIWVIKNHIPRFLWDFDIHEKKDFSIHGKKPRILFAGGANRFAVKGEDLTYNDDISQIEPIIRKTIDEFQWVFMGAQPLRLADLFDEKKIEHVAWEPNFAYPNAIRKMKIDLALSPLLDNHFNQGKSNIKVLEYGAIGCPGIYTDIICYDEVPAFMKVRTGDTNAWEAKIREYFSSEDLRKQVQEIQLEILNQYWLEDHVDEYRNTYREIILKVLKKRGMY